MHVEILQGTLSEDKLWELLQQYNQVEFQVKNEPCRVAIVTKQKAVITVEVDGGNHHYRERFKLIQQLNGYLFMPAAKIGDVLITGRRKREHKVIVYKISTELGRIYYRDTSQRKPKEHFLNGFTANNQVYYPVGWSLPTPTQKAIVEEYGNDIYLCDDLDTTCPPGKPYIKQDFMRLSDGTLLGSTVWLNPDGTVRTEERESALKPGFDELHLNESGYYECDAYDY